MKVFFKKTWGFSEPAWPLAFGIKGNMLKARERLREGDLAAVIGTKTHHTPEHERGRLLGILEPTKEITSTLAFEGIDASNPDFLNEKGEFRWQHALFCKRAWVLEERPKLKDFVSDENYKRYSTGMNQPSVAGLDCFTDDEAERVLALGQREIDLLPLTAQMEEILTKRTKIRTRHSAPPPASQKRRGIMHMRNAPAYTYAFEVRNASRISFKIGWAFEPKRRMREFNKASLPDLKGLEYVGFRTHKWSSAKTAYIMEQNLLRKFAENRDTQNTEIITNVSENDLSSAWNDEIKKLT